MTTHQHAICWTEIPVLDLEKGKAFYDAVLKIDMKITDGGPNKIADFPTTDESGVAGHLYPGNPAPKGTGSTIHLTTNDPLEDVMVRVTKAGGEVLSPAIEIPPGKFFYAHDIDGNSIGFFNYNKA